MSFLTPFFLIGGLAIAGPILYHLVRRTTRENKRFSSLMFLLPSPPRLSKRHRLEHLLLLLLRCAALALLALGFARPFLRQTPIDDPTAVQPKRMVVLVDISASMRRDGVWAAARARVEDVLQRAGPVDHVAVFPFDKQAKALVSFEDWNRTAPADRVAFAVGRVGAISPGWTGTHLGNALITAAEALGENDDGKTAPGPRQIVLVTDLQAGSRLDSLQAYEWPKNVELVVEAVKARNVTNAGVQLVADGPDSNRAVDAPVRVRVSNATDSTREQFKLGWTRPAPAGGGASGAGDFLGAGIDAYVPPGQSRVFSVPVPKGTTGLEQISLRGDDEDFDNTVYFIPPAQQRPSILWVGRDAAEDTKQPLFFVRRAFSETPRVAVQVVATSPATSLPPADVKAATIIFVADPISSETAAALRQEATNGKTVVLVPKTADPAMNAVVGALLGVPAVRLDEARPSNYAMLADIDFQHPLFAPFADPRYSDFTKIHFWKYRRLDPASVPGLRVVAKFDSGEPALAELPVGKGRVYFLASGWHAEDSQLAVSSKFVPLLWSLLEQAGGISNLATQYAVGDSVALPPESAAATIRPPGGSAGEPLAAGTAAYTDTVRPGIYELSGGPRAQRFAVNLDVNESRTTPLGPDELEQLGVPVARAKPGVVKDGENKTILQGLEAESRQKLWRWFIAATLAVLLVESALAGWTARRATSQTEEAAS